MAPLNKRLSKIKPSFA